MGSKKLIWLAILILLLTLLTLGYTATLIKAQPEAPAVATVQPTLQLTISPPRVRTCKEMSAAAALEARRSNPDTPGKALPAHARRRHL